MIDDIGMRVTEYKAEGDNEQTVKRARLDIVVYGDDSAELSYMMLRMTQVIYPIPRTITTRNVIE